jgi:hypothetical protein
MLSRILRLSWLALPALAVAAQTPPTTPESPVVLRFHNNSVVQPAILLDDLVMETKLGKITIPAAEVRRVDFGFRLTEEEARKLEQAIKDLGSEKYPARERATKALTVMGRLAYPALLERRKGADLEQGRRVDAILKNIRARVPAERLRTRTTDIVKTTDSVVTGRVLVDSLRARSELFGEVKFPVSKLRDLRSLLPGGDLTVMVDAGRYGNRTSWMETEFEVQMGTKLEIKASGEINVDPNNTLNNQFTRNVRPDGTRNLGSGEEFNPPGILLGRIGVDGVPFVIGSNYSGRPTREGKLYLRIVTIEHANNVRAAGSYEVRINAEIE